MKEIKKKENIYLKNYENFVNIDGNYGAYQGWLYTEKIKSKFWADRSCGVVAGANILYYLDQNHNKRFYNYNKINKKNFSFFLNDIYKYLRPRIYGIPSIYSMKRGLLSFARKQGVDLKAQTIRMSQADKIIIGSIKEALRDDYPLMMLTWNTKESHLKYHWVTITGYFKDKEDNSFVVTSNWGKREVFNLDKWLKENSFYKGLIYFK